MIFKGIKLKYLLRAFLRQYPLLILAVLVISYDYAWAYIDLSTGSYVIQILLAGLLGALFTLKSYWKNIRNFFSKKSVKKRKRTK